MKDDRRKIAKKIVAEILALEEKRRKFVQKISRLKSEVDILVRNDPLSKRLAGLNSNLHLTERKLSGLDDRLKKLLKQRLQLDIELKRIEAGDPKPLPAHRAANKQLVQVLRHNDILLDTFAKDDVVFDRPQKSGSAHDLFISHASEDKDEVARPLAELLSRVGIRVWFDEFTLNVGDSLRASIDRGLADSTFGLVVLSSHFFAKNWTTYELNGLVSREMEGKKVILPVWHKITKDDVLKFSPSLADKIALNTSLLTIDEIAKKLAIAVRRS